MATIKRKPDFRKDLYEREAWEKDELVCGIDEVGRSCFSGPVVAAAVILHPKAGNRLLKDSKVMTAEQRLEAYGWLMKHSTFAVGIAHHRIIDSHNIYQATLIAMKRALMQVISLSSKYPSIVLVDAMPVKIDHLDIPVVHFNYGESKSKSIAAASIIAKVTRDAMMSRIDHVTPGYGYSSNKGYGTKEHRDGIKEHGLTVLHRMSFITNKSEEDTPMSLFEEPGPSEKIL
jgi:ribonuclease HII